MSIKDQTALVVEGSGERGGTRLVVNVAYMREGERRDTRLVVNVAYIRREGH